MKDMIFLPNVAQRKSMAENVVIELDLNNLEDVKKLNDPDFLKDRGVEFNPLALKRLKDAVKKHNLTSKIENILVIGE